MSPGEHGIWPLLRDPADPWLQPWPDDDLGYADHVASPVVDRTDPESYTRAARRLQDWLDEQDRGAPFDAHALHSLGRAARLPTRLAWDRRPVQVAPERLSEQGVVLEALDGVPDAGQRGVDEILGPWRLTLDPLRDRRTLVHAVAHWAVSGPGRSPAQVWIRSSRAPSARVRQAVRAIYTAPLCVWRAHAAGSGFELEDRVGVDPRRQPDHPVDLDLADRAVRDGQAILARLVPTPTGWFAWAPLRLARLPEPAQLQTLVQLGLARTRLRNRRAMLEDVLRSQGRWFARRVLSLTWP